MTKAQSTMPEMLIAHSLITFGGGVRVAVSSLLLIASPALAASVTWRTNPSTADWNYDANWNPAAVPNGPGDTAKFGPSYAASVSVSAATEVNGVIFKQSAPAFTITVLPSIQLSLTGTGISNNSGGVQDFVGAAGEAGSAGSILFSNTATAGNDTSVTNEGAITSGGGAAAAAFYNTSNAGSATFINRGAVVDGGNGGATFQNEGGTVNGAGGGYVQFFGESTAGNATFINDRVQQDGAAGGGTFFYDESKAANASFGNYYGALTEFFGTSNGGSGKFVNEGGGTIFNENSTAGHGSFTNSGGSSSGVAAGWMYFAGNSSAGRGTFTLDGGASEGAGAASIVFQDQTTAAYGTFVLNDAPISGTYSATLDFRNSASAGNGTFTSTGTATISFYDATTAAFGRFVINGTPNGIFSPNVQFLSSSRAGKSAFTISGGEVPGNSNSGGFAGFFESSSAERSHITVQGGSTAGGILRFFQTSTAGNSSIVLKGAEAGDAGVGGLLRFNDTTTADHANLTAESGVASERGGGRIYFEEDSTGDQASISVYGNGKLDLSLRNAPSADVGSIAGTGNIFLGSITLLVGGAGASTEFSGVIQDGGFNGGSGGSLAKVGSGTLTLASGNIYTGGTLVQGGTLLLANSTGSATGAGPVEVQAGRLGGNGRMSGDLSVGQVNGVAATLSPGSLQSRIGTLRVNKGVAFYSPSIFEFDVDGVTVTADRLTARGVTIEDGQFRMAKLGSNVIPTGTVFTVINNTSPNPITGEFINLPDGASFIFKGNTYQVSYQGGDGNDLTLTVR